MVKEKLDVYKNNDQLAKGTAKSTLIIFDRRCDTVSPILHEFTFQAMAFDLLPIVEIGNKYVYSYETQNEGTKQIILDENDDIWLKIRHEFIGDIDKILNAELIKVQDLNKQTKGMISWHIEAQIRLAPKYLEAKKKLHAYQQMLQQCYDKWGKLKVDIEQDLAVGAESDNNDR